MLKTLSFIGLFLCILIIPNYLDCQLLSVDELEQDNLQTDLHADTQSDRINYLTEGFEDAEFPPVGWQINPDPSWDRNLTSNYLINGIASAKFRGTGSTSGKQLITPLVRIEPGSQLTFNAKTSTAYYGEQLKIKYSTNGTIWSSLTTITITSTATLYNVDLSDIAEGDYYICFETYSANSADINKTYIIDDISGPIMTSSIEYGNLEGYIRNSQDNLPITNATLIIGYESVLSNESGYYNFNNIYTGEFNLHCQAADFISASFAVIIQQDSTATCDVYLNPVPVPFAPANVIVTRTTGALIFNWQHSDNADGYYLYASAEPDGLFEFLTETTENSITLTDSFLSANGINPQYAFFRVCAFNNAD